tara:strand:+ start:1168 stop:1515 length:348 start_codon:yes stop_codon:yes gene_type:complete
MTGFNELDRIDLAHQELLDSGLTHSELTQHYAVELHLGECIVNLRRRQQCWSARLSASVPYEVAKKLNDQWGKTIRVRGAAGPATLQEGEAVLLWEIDDPESLRALIETLKTHFE